MMTERQISLAEAQINLTVKSLVAVACGLDAYATKHGADETIQRFARILRHHAEDLADLPPF